MQAFTTFDDVIRANKKMLYTSGFVGGATWIILSSLYYLAERDNPAMIVYYDDGVTVW